MRNMRKRRTPGVMVDRPRKFRLDEVDPADTGGLDEAQAARRLLRLGQEFGELEDLMAHAAEHALLVVLQGRDAAGKDGLARRLLEHSNVQTVRVEPFKAPTAEELAHDFLWRVHARTPRRGGLTIFNRSHYEDVVAARIHRLVPPRVWKRRYDDINAFERLLAGGGTLILKFFLHVSKDEQEERLLAREADRRKAAKLSVRDWQERELWDEGTAAYEDAIGRCAAPHAPWHVVPADRKWSRDVVVLERIVEVLAAHRAAWRKKLDAVGRAARKELRDWRSGSLDGGARRD